MGKNQHVVPHQGQWGVRGEGNERLTSLHDTQGEAIDAARAIARNQGSEPFIHNRQGQIRDPFQPGREKSVSGRPPAVIPGSTPTRGYNVMVAELAKTILEFIKLVPRFIIALGIAAGTLLFAGDQLLKRIGLTEFVQKYRFALGLTLVLSAALLIVYTALSVLGSIKGWWGKKRFHR